MPKFQVFIPEVHYVVLNVEAADKDEAFNKANDLYGEGETPFEMEYSHTENDMQNWQYKEIP